MKQAVLVDAGSAVTVDVVIVKLTYPPSKRRRSRRRARSSEGKHSRAIWAVEAKRQSPKSVRMSRSRSVSAPAAPAFVRLVRSRFTAAPIDTGSGASDRRQAMHRSADR